MPIRKKPISYPIPAHIPGQHGLSHATHVHCSGTVRFSDEEQHIASSMRTWRGDDYEHRSAAPGQRVQSHTVYEKASHGQRLADDVEA